MKRIVILAAAAALVLTASCAKNTVVDTPKEDVIGISAFSPVATKGSVLTTAKLEDMYKTFNVNAFITVGGTTSQFMTNLPYAYTDKWYYANASDVKYWPATGTINFYGYAPATPKNFTVAASDSILNITVPEATADQNDILVAECLGTSKADHDGTYSAASTKDAVPMVFKHALTQVNFALQNSNTKLDIDVTGIAIENVLNKVDVDFCGKYATSGVVTDYAAKLDVADFKVSETATTVTTGSPMVLAPQSTATTAWDKTAAGAATQSRFALTLKIVDKASGVVIYDGIAYVPASFAWENGKNYTYTFVFGEGAGVDPNGDKILDIITFNPSVQTWTPVAETPSMN